MVTGVPELDPAFNDTASCFKAKVTPHKKAAVGTVHTLCRRLIKKFNMQGGQQKVVGAGTTATKSGKDGTHDDDVQDQDMDDLGS